MRYILVTSLSLLRCCFGKDKLVFQINAYEVRPSGEHKLQFMLWQNAPRSALMPQSSLWDMSARRGESKLVDLQKRTTNKATSVFHPPFFKITVCTTIGLNVALFLTNILN